MGRRRTGAAQVGAAYTQLFKGREIKGMVMGKNGIEIENLNLGENLDVSRLNRLKMEKSGDYSPLPFISFFF